MSCHAPLRRNLLALLVCASLPSLAAAETAPAVDAQSATTLDSVSVIGRGEARQVQRVTAEDMKVLPPGANPLKLLASKPGVHFESATPPVPTSGPPASACAASTRTAWATRSMASRWAT